MGSSKKQKNTPRNKSQSKSSKYKPGRRTKSKPKKVKTIKKKNTNRKTKPRKCERQTGADDTTGLVNKELAMDYEGKQIKNFKNQKKRVEDFDKLMQNKGGKKDNVQNTAVMEQQIKRMPRMPYQPTPHLATAPPLWR